MKDETLEFYDRNARVISGKYDAIEIDESWDRPLQYVPAGGRILELGTGSGRDASRYLSKGFDVTGVDGSACMIDEAIALHPELDGRLIHHVLPDALPFGDESFDVVTSWAMIMHLELTDISPVMAEVARVLVNEGLLVYSVNTKRSGLDKDGRDDRRRHFTCLEANRWEELHRKAGFETFSATESADIAKREGIYWVTFYARKQLAR